MGLGGSWDTPSYVKDDIDTAHVALAHAQSLGIDLIDTADIYRRGASEAVIGEVFSRDEDLAQHFKVQTKCSILLPDEQHAHTRYNSSGDYVREAIEKSADKLGRAPEIMLLHRADPLMDVRDTGFAIKAALDAGTIGDWGVSNFSAWQIERLADHVGSYPVVNQLELSLRARGFVEAAMNVAFESRPGSHYTPGTVEYCHDHGIQVQAWSPLAGGALADSRKLSDIAAIHGTTPAVIALWWLTCQGIVPVVGTTNPAHIDALAQAMQAPRLSREQWYELLSEARGMDCP